jgi:multicomponent Na+:H+ antiporter subunit E
MTAPAVRSAALGALLALLWFVLTAGAVSSWIVGLPTIAAALVLARRVERPTSRWRLDAKGVLRFVTYFVRESLRDAIDVAGRVSARRLRIAPGLVRYRWRLPADGPARALFALSASLLPGTLVAALGEQEVLIHALDANAPVADELAALEQRVAGLFALRLSPTEVSETMEAMDA